MTRNKLFAVLLASLVACTAVAETPGPYQDHTEESLSESGIITNFTVKKREEPTTVRRKPQKEEVEKDIALEKFSTETQYPRKMEEYIITPGDVLHVSVWEEPDLNQEVIVRPDGRVSFPLAGELIAAGKTVPGLNEKFTERLKKYIRDPVVSTSVKESVGIPVLILGQVGRPDMYFLRGPQTLLEAVSRAYGFTDDAVFSSVIVIRGGFNSPEVMRVNINRAISRGDMSQNPVLQAHDVVYVPKKFVAHIHYYAMQIIQPIAQAVYVARAVQPW